jgi:hypothetical protein
VLHPNPNRFRSPLTPALIQQLNAILSPSGLVGRLHPDILLQWEYVYEPNCAVVANDFLNSWQNLVGIFAIVDSLCRANLQSAFGATSLPLYFVGQGLSDELDALPAFTFDSPTVDSLVGLGLMLTQFGWMQPAILTTAVLTPAQVQAFASVGIGRTVQVATFTGSNCSVALSSIATAVTQVNEALSPLIVVDV